MLINLPLRAVRLATDPMVDTVIVLTKPLGLYLFNAVLRFFNVLGLVQVERMVRQWTQEVPAGGQSATETASPHALISQRLHSLAQLLSRNITFRDFSERGVSWYQQALATYMKFAHGDTTTDRVLFIMVGYSIVGVLVAFYLNILTVGNIQNAGRAVRTVVKQQLMVMKVGLNLLTHTRLVH